MLFVAMGSEGNSDFMSAIALLDLINSTKTYKPMVVQGINTVVDLSITAALQPSVLWFYEASASCTDTYYVLIA